MTYVFGTFALIAFVFSLAALTKVNKLGKMLNDKEEK